MMIARVAASFHRSLDHRQLFTRQRINRRRRGLDLFLLLGLSGRLGGQDRLLFPLDEGVVVVSLNSDGYLVERHTSADVFAVIQVFSRSALALVMLGQVPSYGVIWETVT